jgi:hypothetical protein
MCARPCTAAMHAALPLVPLLCPCCCSFLPKATQIVGYARTHMTDEEFHDRIRAHIKGDAAKLDRFLKLCSYMAGDVSHTRHTEQPLWHTQLSCDMQPPGLLRQPCTRARGGQLGVTHREWQPPVCERGHVGKVVRQMQDNVLRMSLARTSPHCTTTLYWTASLLYRMPPPLCSTLPAHQATRPWPRRWLTGSTSQPTQQDACSTWRCHHMCTLRWVCVLRARRGRQQWQGAGGVCAFGAPSWRAPARWQCDVCCSAYETASQLTHS